MRNLSKYIFVIAIFIILLSCEKKTAEKSEDINNIDETQELVTWSGAWPMVILQAGEYPLWFTLTEDGPLHIDSIEEAVNKNALIPWPYALHILYLTETDDGLIMTVNRDGFLKIKRNDDGNNGIALYRFSGGNYWKQFTVGGFVFYDGNPAALLYFDDLFIDNAASSQNALASQFSRTWSFNMNSNIPYPVEIPILNLFPEDEGWVIETLRQGSGGYFYCKAVRKNSMRNEVKMFRVRDLSQTNASAVSEISSEIFYSSAPGDSDFFHPRLPPLPEGFAYTGIGNAADSLFASWEEQTDYSIGAAGFVVIKP